jgi:hypothetical protein
MKFVALIPLLFLLVACGYKPTSHYTKAVLGSKIYIQVPPPAHDPISGITIHNYLNQAINFTFKSHLVPKEEANTILNIEKIEHSITELQKDENGFTILYRTNVALHSYLKNENFSKRFIVYGYHDYTVSANSLSYEEIRINAIKEASLKAAAELATKITSIGALYVNE